METNGVIIINKGQGMTSQTVVNRVKRALGLSKAGHTGTLDPMATGVLPVLCNRGVKCSEYLTASEKHYRAILLFGVETDTEDITGEVLTTSDRFPDDEEIAGVLSAFRGDILQVPPMYSALKRDGQKLCDLARRGITVAREARPIRIDRLTAERIDDRRISLDVVCSKGTYIRTLCTDIARALGTVGTMEALTRVESAGFTLDDAITLEELLALSEEERQRRIVPVEQLFSRFSDLRLPAFFAHLARNGCEIYLKKIGAAYPLGTRLCICDEKGCFFALGEVCDYPQGAAVRMLKQF